MKTGKQIRIFKGHEGNVNVVAISPDGRWVLSGCDTSGLRIGKTDLETFLLAGTPEETLWQWDIENAKCMQKLLGHPADPYGPAGGVIAISVSPNGLWALTGGL